MRPTLSRLLGLSLLAGLLFSGAGCGGPSAAELKADTPATLKVWRVFDGQDTLQPTMEAYQKLHANISFEYRTLRSDTYKDELVRAFAEGRGPDIFSLHNTWIGEEQALIAPMPKSLTIPYVEITGTLKKEKIVTLKTQPTISLRQLKSDFLDVVSDDVVRPYQPPEPKAPLEQRVWGLPLSVDTMALFYNKDLLNAANIAAPAATWAEFQKQVAKLTSIGSNDEIIQSGAALGTSRNVERAVDILALLMMQNGTVMVSDRGAAAFASDDESRVVPGAEATRFYTDFANPVKEVYSWNSKQPNSFEAFVAGKTAFYFGYSYHVPLIRARNPKLKFAVAPMPQINDARSVNFANYWVETVAKASPNQTWAWDFVQFATKADQAKTYLTAARKPPALRSLIASQLEDEDLSVFANQLLSAKSWYRGNNASVAEQAFLTLIDAVNAGTVAEDAIGDAQNKVNQTL